MPQRATTRPGFTLIEVLLAIALSAVLMALLGSAINLYLLRVDASRSAVENAQLARGVLRLIADDLRSMAVVYEQDISSAQAAAESQALFDVDEADQDPTDSGSGDSDTQATERPYVGVTGDASSIQIDVLRLRPSYQVNPEDPSLPVTVSYVSPGITGVRYYLTEEGLVRQLVGRDIAIQQELQGLTEAWDASSRVVAPEVADLRFRYHDGEQALEYWDLEEQEGALPLAVEVRVGLRTAGPQQPAGDATPLEEQPIKYYRVTVALPVPTAAAAAEETEVSSSDTGSGA